MADPQLLPCPHCGGLPAWNVGAEGEHWIDCPRCCASTGLRYSLMTDCRPVLAEQWNSRQDGCAALKALIAHWDEFGPEHGFDELVDRARKTVVTPPPPGAASPGVPSLPPYKYSWPGERAPDALHIKDNAVAVDPDYFYRPMVTCPRGVKCVLLNEGGVATIAVYAGEPHWRGWAPLPKERRG